MDKYEIKNNKSKIIKEWSDFFKNESEHNEEKIPATDENYKRFGEMMYEVVYQLDGASNLMWTCVYPSGTEDRTWYRLFARVFKIGGDYKLNLYGSGDSGQEVDMLLDFYKVGVINKREFAETLDWRETKTMKILKK